MPGVNSHTQTCRLEMGSLRTNVNARSEQGLSRPGLASTASYPLPHSTSAPLLSSPSPPDLYQPPSRHVEQNPEKSSGSPNVNRNEPLWNTGSQIYGLSVNTLRSCTLLSSRGVCGERVGSLLRCQPRNHTSLRSLSSHEPAHLGRCFLGTEEGFFFQQTNRKGGSVQSGEASSGGEKKSPPPPSSFSHPWFTLLPPSPTWLPSPPAPPVLCCAGWIPGSC